MSEISSRATPVAEPRQGGIRAWWIWALAVTFVILLFNVQTGYAILNSRVAEDLQLSLEQIGFVAACYTWVFAIAQLFSGALLDRVGARKVLLPAIALVTMGVFLFAFAESYEMILISQIVLAVGSCAGFVGAGYVGGVWFGMARFGFMFGLVQLVAALSSAFGQAGFDAALLRWSWREVMNGFGIFGVGLLLLAMLFVRNPRPVESSRQQGGFVAGVLASIAEVLKKPQIWIVSLVGAITFGAVLALGVVWMPKLLVAHGLSESNANWSTACIWLGLAAGSPLIARWSDATRSRRQPIILTTLVQVALVAALVYMPMSPMLAMALCFCFGFANAGHMLSFSAAADIVPPRLIGTSASIVNGSMFILGGVLMGLPGKFLDDGATTLAGFQTAMLPCVGTLIVSGLLAFAIKESYPRS
ncbi:MFS transporter [Pseudoxanthomonas indica]|uniref:Sugar phosphate permease n=1 Tax=Pseudoxanthomonas indica TaxID=428993 RepID=A0A1T5KF02_9GAMM|nr:MFS transporter [Pseudoxanthomonas indica]GGD48771.1 MFS transporter [Pseudoxanthomonas indica]SKC61938.1 Sugar phosphate permease [Pseudoxanthomonas indica]